MHAFDKVSIVDYSIGGPTYLHSVSSPHESHWQRCQVHRWGLRPRHLLSGSQRTGSQG